MQCPDNIEDSWYLFLWRFIDGINVYRPCQQTWNAEFSYIPFQYARSLGPCNVNSSKNEHIQVLSNRDSGGNAFPYSPRGEYKIDNMSQSFITNSSDRVLGILNLGAHYHNMTHYTEDVDTMLQTLSDLNRPQDLYFFRATSPGFMTTVYLEIENLIVFFS